MMVGRWDFMRAFLRRDLVSFDGMKAQLARDRARDQSPDLQGRSAVPHRSSPHAFRVFGRLPATKRGLKKFDELAAG
jgi:hypothetical protein